MDVQGWVVIGLAAVLFGYLVPHLVLSRHQLAQARVEDRFSTSLRVVTTGAGARRSAPGEHHGSPGNRPYLHDPRRRTEAPAVNRPTTPSERAATEARRRAAARAARAAEISRRRAAARRRLVLTVVLLLASVGGWLGAGLASMSIVVGVVPTVLLGAVLVLGRRAAKIAARRNAADRAAMARLGVQPTPRTRPASSVGHNAARGPEARATASPGATAPSEAIAPAEESVARDEDTGPTATEVTPSSSTGDATSTGRQSAGRSADSSAPVTGSGPAGADDEGGDWTPVPVPAPSYTLKAPAPRRDIAPYQAPTEEHAVAAEETPERVVTAGLAGSPYAPVVDPEPTAAPAPMPPSRGLDLDSALARRRGA